MQILIVMKVVIRIHIYMPDISVSLDIEVVKVVCVLHLAKVWSFKSLNDLCFHDTGDVSWQQR